MAKFSYGDMVRHVKFGIGLVTFEDAEHAYESHVSFYEHDERWVLDSELTLIPRQDTLRLDWMLKHSNPNGHTRSSVDRAIENKH
ncbi:hypothetical protein PL75_01035 [Neisseria arctica]|uniref:Uncharacterized protein n=1 Tax=Neisseria arctica TaxID=1470200 RepID=A0A0J0YTZ0_9NEIS|nr:hypothetical protein [Neisseria arctica]KLT73571.1 hypothetical protein PL75_01035 [Neisseria arctica]UOO85686.1 hypothetical protein LVJ86_05445 [Neisseria arctica]